MQSVKCQVKDVNQTALYTPDLVAAMSDVPNRSTRRLRTQIACYTCRRGKRKVSIALQRGSPIRYLITLHSVTASNQFAHYLSGPGRNACMPQRLFQGGEHKLSFQWAWRDDMTDVRVTTQ